MVELFPTGNILTCMTLRELKITLHPNAKISLFSNKTTNTTSVWKYPRTEHTPIHVENVFDEEIMIMKNLLKKVVSTRTVTS